MGQARRALRSAEILRDAGQYGWACFTSQQTAELALKVGLEFRALERGGPEQDGTGTASVSRQTASDCRCIAKPLRGM